jgi:hypothetical protein
LRIAAIGIAAGGLKIQAQILMTAQAELACPASGKDPGDTDPIAFFDVLYLASDCFNAAYDLMPRDNRQMRWRCSAFDLIEFGVANAAGRNLEQNFSVAGFGSGKVYPFKRRLIIF